MEISRHSHKLPETFTHVHTHAYEIMYCIRGSYLFHYEQQDHAMMENIVCKPKTMIFIPKNVPHGLRVQRYPYERYFISFSDRTAEMVLNQPTFLSIFSQNEQSAEEAKGPIPRFLNIAPAADEIEKLLEQMYDVHFSVDMDNDWKNVHLNSLFGLFFCELYRHFRSFFSQSLVQYTPPIQAAKNHIDQHYDQPLTIQQLAQECFLSVNYLSKCFHSQIGMSPHQYLTQTRLAAAKKLLCSSRMPIQEIAVQAGFGDVNYFIHHFKACFGTTPKQYRKTFIEEKIRD